MSRWRLAWVTRWPSRRMAVSSRSSLARSAEGTSQLYVRRLRELTEVQATALPGTDGADSPFFSPDGQQIAFFAGGKLKRIAVTGGAPVTVCDAPTRRCARGRRRDMG